MNDLISRAAAIEAIRKLQGKLEITALDGREKMLIDKAEAQTELMLLPTAQKWYMITSRPMTEDERKERSEKVGYDIPQDEAVIYNCPLPDDEQVVIIYTNWGKVYFDIFHDDRDRCYFEYNGDMDGITAWIPLPEPPRG